jgi:hypothetical protein
MSKSKLLYRIADAVEVEPEEHDIDASTEVMDYARHHREEIYASDKEVPEVFHDIRPDENSGGEVDPGFFLVPKSLSGSQLGKDAAVISNYRIFIKRFGDIDGVFPITGDKGSFGIAIRISSITRAILDDLKALDQAPILDEEDHAQAEHEAIDEAWGDWARYDFIRALEKKFPDQAELIDKLDEDQTRELFDRLCRNIGIDWVEDSASVYIDVERVAEGVTEQDLSS